jgi:GAF domain-containing protein
MLKREMPIEVQKNTIEKWQQIVDVMAEIMGIPAGLIMRLDDPYIEVFVSSKSEGNPYHPGDKEKVWGSGLYCETVIKNNDKLLVPNALKDENWKNNPDIKLNMVSYLGLPVLLPDGRPFGTICVLDNQENPYSSGFEKLLLNFRDLIQSDLEIIYMNQTLGDENKRLNDYISEIQTLRGILPICMHCKKIKDDAGYWNQIETYIAKHSEVQFSHSICRECANKLYPGMDLYEDV